MHPVVDVLVQAFVVRVRNNALLRAFNLVKVFKMRLNCLHLSLPVFSLHLLGCPEPIGKHIKFFLHFNLVVFLMLIDLLFESVGILKIILNHRFLKCLSSSMRSAKRWLSDIANGGLRLWSSEWIYFFSFNTFIIIIVILNSFDLKQSFIVTTYVFNLFLVHAGNISLCAFSPLITNFLLNSIF